MRLAESPNNSAETRALRCPAQDDEETAAARALSGKVGTGFPKRSCSNKKIERDDDSKKSHPALRIPRRYSHFVFGIIQSGVTCAIAAAIASYPLLSEGSFVWHWLQSWALAWLFMLPVVVFAAPGIRKLTYVLTSD